MENNDALTLAEENPFFVVGIGASAGGLEAIEALFRNMPCHTGMAFVIVQHLSPDFESHMAELLARQTEIPIHAVEEGMRVEPDAIYLMPPKKEMIISGGRLRLADKAPERGLALPIDHFFRSLAQDLQGRSIGIVLSGTGSDGSRGVKEIHEAGGLVICQNEDTAKFPGMPMNAVSTGVVDLVLSPADMPSVLLSYVRNPADRGKLTERNLGTLPGTGIGKILHLLRDAYNIDFSHYKPQTVMRRVERRIAMRQDVDLDAYAERLSEDPDELNNMYRDLLIGVTHFFRDPEAFEQLERVAIPEILSRRGPRDEIRCWVAGCATGEEVYSLAILFHEQLTRAGRPIQVKIFATDVHRASLTFASAGVYHEEALADVTRERRDRYFTKEAGGYQVAAELRQMVVFAPHNVLTDAPFTKMDLVSCRNMLIYLQPSAQKTALTLFHFALNPGGILFLGSSETPGELADEFEALDKRWRIYRKLRDIRLAHSIQMGGMPSRGIAGPLADPTGVFSRRAVSDNRLFEVYDRLLARFLPSGFLVDSNDALLHTFGDGGRYLRIRSGRLSSSILDLVHPDLRTALAAAMHQAMKDGRPVRYSSLQVALPEETESLELIVDPLEDLRTQSPQLLITLEKQTRPATFPGVEVNVADMSREHVQSLEAELRFTRENLQATVEELETSNEELQAANEELVASNEELQSTNEELHSVNEELHTVNTEHQRKIHELTEITDDLDNLLTSSDLGVVFLDESLCIRKFTPRMAELFHLLAQDTGRPIGGFSHTIDYPSLVADLQTVLREGTVVEKEVHDREGCPYFIRILPYRSTLRVAGVVLTLVDISALKRQEAISDRLSKIVESSDDAILALTLDGLVTAWNRGAERLYGYSRGEAIGQRLEELIVPEDRREELRQLHRQLQAGERLEPIETTRRRKDGRLVDISLRVSAVRDERGRLTEIAAIDRDITESRTMQRRLKLEHGVTQVLAESRSLDEALPEIVEAVGECLNLDACEYWSPHEASHRMICRALHVGKGWAWRRLWTETTARHSLGKGEGLAGRVWDQGQPIWITDLAGDERFERREATGRLGIRAGFGFPIMAGGACVGVICGFSRERCERDAAIEQMMNTLGREIGQFSLWVESENQLRRLAQVVEQTTDFVGTCDLELRILSINRGGRRLIEIDESREVHGTPLAQMQPEWAYRLVRDEGVPAASRDGVWLGETALLTGDGQVIPVSQMLLAHHTPTGEVSYYSTVIRDLRQQKASEREVTEARETAEAANAAKSVFIANISHEVRTPMTSIIGLTELLLNQETDQQRREMLDMILENSRYLTEILNDILDLSKIEAGRLDVESVEFSPVELINDIGSFLAIRARQNNLPLRVEYATLMPRRITSDPVRLRQILINLIGNAIKFTERGEIRVVVELAPNRQMRIHVIDTGVGIPEEKLSAVFEPFVQADTSSGRRAAGTGLGLAISRRLANALGGILEAESRAGEGSHFTLTVPVGEVDESQLVEAHTLIEGPAVQLPREPVTVDLSGRRILVAEDTPALQYVIRKLLEVAGAQVEVVPDGKEALDRIADGNGRTPFDLIVLDMHMPRVDGYEAARRLRASDYPAPIIALTASAMEGDRERCLSSGCNGYIPKPLDRDMLLHTIATVLDL